MKLIKHDNAKTLFFVSGMFAGGWIWKESHTDIPNTQHLLLDDPLCVIGNTVGKISEHIIEELTKLDKKVTMIGNSLGSFVCLDIAKRAPDLVESVVISGSAGFGEISLDVKLSHKKPLNVAKSLMNIICYDKGRVSSEATTKTAESFKNSFRSILNLIRESNSVDATELLKEIKCPVYAIWGENDEVTPYSLAASTFSSLNIPVSLIKECGHSPMYEKPKEFASCVSEYLK